MSHNMENMDIENHDSYESSEKYNLTVPSDIDSSNKENDMNYNIIKDSKKDLDATYELDASEYNMQLKLPCTPLTSPKMTDSESSDLPKRSVDHEIYFDSINFTNETYLPKLAQSDNLLNVSPKLEKTSPINANIDNVTTKTESHDLEESTFMRGLKNVINLFRHSPKNIEKPSNNECIQESLNDSVQEYLNLCEGIREIHRSDNVNNPDFSSTPIISQTKVKRVTDHSGFDKTKNSKTMFTESFINELSWEDDSTVIFNTDKLNNVLSMNLQNSSSNIDTVEFPGVPLTNDSKSAPRIPDHGISNTPKLTEKKETEFDIHMKQDCFETVESKNNVNISTNMRNHATDGDVLNQSLDIQTADPNKYFFPEEFMDCDIKPKIEDSRESFISSQTSEKELLSYDQPIKIEESQNLNTSNITHVKEVVFLPDKLKDESFSSNAPCQSLEKRTNNVNPITMEIENTENQDSKMDLVSVYLSGNSENKTSQTLQSSFELDNNTVISPYNINKITLFSENIQSDKRDSEICDSNITLKATQITHEAKNSAFTSNQSEFKIMKLACSNIENNTSSSVYVDNNCNFSSTVDVNVELNNCCNSNAIKSASLGEECNNSLVNQLSPLTPYDTSHLVNNITNETRKNHTKFIGEALNNNIRECKFFHPSNEAVPLNNLNDNLFLDQHKQDTCNLINSEVLHIFEHDIVPKDSSAWLNNDSDESHKLNNSESFTNEANNRHLQNKLSISTPLHVSHVERKITSNEIPIKHTNIIPKIMDIDIIECDESVINNKDFSSNCVNISSDQNKQNTYDVTNEIPIILIDDNLPGVAIANNGASFLNHDTDNISSDEYQQDNCAVTNSGSFGIDSLLKVSLTDKEMVSSATICTDQNEPDTFDANNDISVVIGGDKVNGTFVNTKEDFIDTVENIDIETIYENRETIHDYKDPIEVVNGMHKNQLLAVKNICKSNYTNTTTEALYLDGNSDKSIIFSEVSQDANETHVKKIKPTVFNNMTNDNLFSEEKFTSGECFNDSKAFDFLMGCSNNNLMIGAKDSLFLKFDPLYAALSPNLDSPLNHTNKNIYNLSDSEESYENRSIDIDLQKNNNDMFYDLTTETEKNATENKIVFEKEQDDKKVNNTICSKDVCHFNGNNSICLNAKHKQTDSQSELNIDGLCNLTFDVIENNNKHVNESQTIKNNMSNNSLSTECLPEFQLTNETSINNDLIDSEPKSPDSNYPSNIKQNLENTIVGIKAIDLKPECLQITKYETDNLYMNKSIEKNYGNVDISVKMNESNTKSNVPISHLTPENTKYETIYKRLDTMDSLTCEYNNTLISSQSVSLKNKELVAYNTEKSKSDLFPLEKTESVDSKTLQPDANFLNRSTDMDFNTHKKVLIIDVAVLNEDVNDLSPKSNKSIECNLSTPIIYRKQSEIEEYLGKENEKTSHLILNTERDIKYNDIVALKHKKNTSLEKDEIISENTSPEEQCPVNSSFENTITSVNKQLESSDSYTETIQQLENFIEEVTYPNTTQNCSIESSQTCPLNSLVQCQELQYQDSIAIENLLKPNINCKDSLIDKPILAVSPAVNSSSFTADTTFITRDNNLISPAITAINRLISFGSNSLNFECRSNDDLKNQIELFEKESMRKAVDLVKLKEENVILERKLLEQNKSIEMLTKENIEKFNLLSNYSKNIDKNVKSIDGMKRVVLEYEQTMSKLISERENDRKQYLEERKMILQDRDEQTSHLSSMERTFNDLHAKFEKCKVIILEYKEKEDRLTEVGEKNIDKLNKLQETYDQLKHHAAKSLQLANSKLSRENKVHEAEVIKIKAILKRKEMVISSIEEELARVTRNNAELTAFCDDLISKVG